MVDTALADVEVSEPHTRMHMTELAAKLEPMILELEDRIESERKMPDEITDAMYEGGMYRAFLPREVGGLDMDPIEWLDGVEAFSHINGSVGWLCMLHTGATWVKPEPMRRILENERWITASNVGRAGGIARKVEGGYRITGRWPFCSGSPEATYLSGRSVLHDENDEPMVSPKDGLPYYISAYMRADQVTLHDTWDGLGLRGTGSGDISVDDIFVPRELVNESGIWTHPYESPLQHANFNLAAHAAHAIGLARAALDEFQKSTLLKARRGSFRQARFGKEQTNFITAGKADYQIRSARLFMRDVISRAYEDAQRNVHIDYELRVLMHEVNVGVVDTCRDVVDAIFREMGVAGIFKGQRMERIFRDMMTAAQHAVVVYKTYDRPGQYLLTRDTPDGPQLDIEQSFVRGPHPQNQHRWDA